MAITRRGLHASLSVIAAAVLMAGCATPAVQVSRGPSATSIATESASDAPTTPTPTGATPTMATTPMPTSAPSASPPVSYQYSDILRVEVDGLAVREAPSLTSPLAQGYRDVGGTAQPTGDVRLDAGYFVSVHLGPLRSGDSVWYLVWPAEDARLHYNTGTWWDSNGDSDTVGGVDPGWVAGSVGEDQYVTLFRRPEPSEIEQFVPFGLTLSGTGNYESEPHGGSDLFMFHWAVAVDDAPAPCAFSVALLPEGGAAPMIAAETSTADVAQGPLTGPGSQVHTPWGASDAFTVSITSACTWTIGLQELGHD